MIKFSKKISALLILVLLMSGCSDSKVVKLEEENKALKAKVKSYEELYGELNTKQTSTHDSDDLINDHNNINNIEEINIGELISIEDYGEFTISEAKFSQRVEPSNPTSYYSYYEVKDPNITYLDTIINFKNNSTIGLDVSQIVNVRILFDNKYNYTSFSVAEESDGSDMDIFAKVDPLSKVKIHNLSEVPLEVQESNKPISIFINVYENTYKLNIN